MADPTPPKDPDQPESELRHALDELGKVLSRIPFAHQLQTDLRELRGVLVDRRPPRIAAIGRRGSGKSSLANALMGTEVLSTGAVADTTKDAQWLELTHNGRKLRWLDTPGLRAGERPERRDAVRKALADEPPDVVLLTCKATQVDAGITEDLAEIKWLLDRQRSIGLTPPAVVALVTKVDELAPLAVKSPPYRGDKRANIDRAVEVFKEHLTRAGVTPAAVLPVGTYMRFFKDRTVAVDWRWNLSTLGDALFAALPLPARFEAARAFDGVRTLRRRVARRIVAATTSIAFAVGAIPIPVADLALLAPLQSTMVTSLVILGGRRTDAKGISEWLAGLGINTGAGFALREIARALSKLLPGVSGSISCAIAASGTWALGLSAIAYFIDDASLEASRKAFDDARRAGPPAQLPDGADAGASASAAADAMSPVAVPAPEPAGEPSEGTPGDPPRES